MKVYFVRHGSTDSLEKKISQPDDEPLNKRGLDQAKELGKRFTNNPINLIISSPHLRAVQTAKEIGENIEINSLFAEFKKPHEVVGQPKSNEETKKFWNKINEMSIIDSSWHYSDEENFEDLKHRGLEALNYLRNLNLENIVVVSHGNFVSLLVGLMMFEDDYPLKLFVKIKGFFRLSNTGVSICNLNEDKWTLECWNDTSHRLE